MKRFDRQRPQNLLRPTVRKFVSGNRCWRWTASPRYQTNPEESGSLTPLDEPLRRTGVELPPERDEGYYAEALNF